MLLLNYLSFLRQLAGSANKYQNYPAPSFFPSHIFKKDSCIDEVSSVNRLLLPQEAKHIKHLFFYYLPSHNLPH